MTNIDNYAFYECSGLTSITIPNSVTRIGVYAFSGCSGLTSITIPNSVTTILSYAFQYCTGLKNVTLGNSVTSIGRYAFYDCNKLTSIEIPYSVTSIGEFAFYWCESLTSIEIPNSVTSLGLKAFGKCSKLASVSIPNSVTSIGENAFWYCSNIETLEWDNSLSPSCVIQECKENIKSVTLGNSVTSIEDNAFNGCSSLACITIPNSVTNLGHHSFYDCSSLTSIELPNSVKSIGNYAFYGCSGLTSIEIPNAVTSIGEEAFHYCSSLKNVTISNSLTSIADYTFYGCSSLTYVTIPNSVTSIGKYAFASNSDLLGVEIPSSVTSIGNYAFRNCNEKGFNVIAEWTTPPTINSTVFANTDDSYLSKCNLYVPAGSQENYTSADVWKDFNIYYGGKPDIYYTDADGNNGSYKATANVTILDSYKQFNVLSDVNGVNVTYSRTYKNTNWQPWYVPFGMELDKTTLNNFSFAKFAGTYTEEEEFFLTVVRLKEGDYMKPNTPYFVQAKTENSGTPQDITAYNTVLKATKISSITMHSAEQEINVYGTYQPKIATADDLDWYFFSGGLYCLPDVGTKLGAFRFYVTITDREDNPYTTGPTSTVIKIMEIGNGADGIEDLATAKASTEGSDIMYNLAGQPVGSDYKGIVIKNGKKIYLR